MKRLFFLFCILLNTLALFAQIPAINSISPGVISSGQGKTLNLVISGTNTNFTQGSNNVYLFNGATNLVVNSTTAINNENLQANIYIPNNASDGPYSLYLFNSLAQSAVFRNAAVVLTTGNNLPINSVSPSQGKQGQTLNLTITGINTHFNQATNIKVTLLGVATNIEANYASAMSNTQLNANVSIPFSAASGIHSVMVWTSNEGYFAKLNSFQITAGTQLTHQIVSVSPNKGKKGETLNLTITGMNTNFMQASNIKVALLGSGSPIEANYASAITSTKLNANITLPFSAASGLHDVMVWTDNEGYGTKTNSFEITAGTHLTHQIVSVLPNEGQNGETLNLTITGMNTHFMQASNISVGLLGSGTPIMANYANAINNNQLNANITLPFSAASGLRDLMVWTDNEGYGIETNAFEIKAASQLSPQITNVSPNKGKKGETLNLTITGMNTNFMQASNIKVALLGSGSPIEANYASAITSTKLNANITLPFSAASGLHDVMVWTDNEGYGTKTNSFEITAGTQLTHQIVSVSPNEGKNGETLNLTITGMNTHFMQASNISVSLLGLGTPIIANYANAINNSQLNANITLPFSAASGMRNVLVWTDNEGYGTKLNAFEIKSATQLNAQITNVSPSEGKQGETLNLTITGMNTLFAQASSIKVTLMVAGTPIESNYANAINNTKFNANISIPFSAATGICSVLVWTDNQGYAAKPNAFQIKAAAPVSPQITGITPAEGKKGETLNLTITGRNTHFLQAHQQSLTFIGAGTSITVNNITAITNTSLEANISIGANAVAASYIVRLFNSNDGTIFSQQSFKVTAASNNPSLASVTPNGALLGSTLNLTITGTNTNFMQATSLTVYLFNSATMIESNSVTKLSDTQLKANIVIPQQLTSIGLYNLAVVDGSRFYQLDSSFNIISVGIDDIKSKMDLIDVYPVPVKHIININSNVPINRFSLINSLGQEVLFKEDEIEKRPNAYSLNIENKKLKSGIYYLRFTIESQTGFKKIVIE